MQKLLLFSIAVTVLEVVRGENLRVAQPKHVVAKECLLLLLSVLRQVAFLAPSPLSGNAEKSRIAVAVGQILWSASLKGMRWQRKVE